MGPTIDSYYFQVLTEGYAPYMFYVYHQLYDEGPKPIEGAYADVNATFRSIQATSTATILLHLIT